MYYWRGIYNICIYLTDLNPQFMARHGRYGQGIIFTCPVCGGFIAASFKNPIDGGKPFKTTPLWDRVGDTYETLSLQPAVKDLTEDGECWQGYITDGRIVNV